MALYLCWRAGCQESNQKDAWFLEAKAGKPNHAPSVTFSWPTQVTGPAHFQGVGLYLLMEEVAKPHGEGHGYRKDEESWLLLQSAASGESVLAIPGFL